MKWQVKLQRLINVSKIFTLLNMQQFKDVTEMQLTHLETFLFRF